MAQQPKLFVAMILILIFAEVLGKFSWGRKGWNWQVLIRCIGLYGMIVALMLVTQSKVGVGEC